MSLPFGLALYTVRDQMEQDPAGTLKKVKAMGYDNVELLFVDQLKPDIKTMLDDAGLNAVSGHVLFEPITQQTEAVIAAAHRFGLPYVIMPWYGPPKAQSKDDWARAAQELSEAGAKFRAAGIQLCYHNHGHEMKEIDGERILDVIASNSDKKNLAFEIDTYWAKFGGVDPVALITAFSGRCPVLHIKDMTPGDNPTFAEAGEGIIDWKPIFEAGRKAGTKWNIIEQDICQRDPLESAAISAAFMKRQ